MSLENMTAQILRVRAMCMGDAKLHVRQQDENSRISGHATYCKIRGIGSDFFVPVTGTRAKVLMESAIPS